MHACLVPEMGTITLIFFRKSSPVISDHFISLKMMIANNQGTRGRGGHKCQNGGDLKCGWPLRENNHDLIIND